MDTKKLIFLGASALAAGAVVAGGVNLATAATGDGEGSGSTGSARGYGFGDRGPGMRGPMGHDHAPVTGAEKTKVVDAVTAKYADVTVVAVMQDEDGSYDVMGTQDGSAVRLEVSKDLATIELMTGGPMGGPGMGPGGPRMGWGGAEQDATPSTKT